MVTMNVERVSVTAVEWEKAMKWILAALGSLLVCVLLVSSLTGTGAAQELSAPKKQWIFAPPAQPLSTSSNKPIRTNLLGTNTAGMIRIPNGLYQQATLTMIANTSIEHNDAAERINAAAMKDYQRRFENHLRQPTGIPLPVLYPTRVQKMVEEMK